MLDDGEWPTCLPPRSVDRPEYVEPWLLMWSYVLSVHPLMIPFDPTVDNRGRPDGGFEISLTDIPWERVRVPQPRCRSQAPYDGQVAVTPIMHG